MKRHLIPESGRFYKANMHMHTTVSDGVGSPEEIKKAYMDAGYSIVAYSDHEVLVEHNDLTDENFLAITSFEKTINKSTEKTYSHMTTAHLNFFAKDPNNISLSVLNPETAWGNAKNYITEEMKKFAYKAEYSAEGLNDVIKRANDEGFLVTLNHPVWSLENYDDYKDLKGLWGIEVYNTASDLEGYPDTVQPFEDLLRKGERLYPLCTDDAHKPYDRFGGFIMIKADKLEYKTIMAALEKGDFYASTGPSIYDIAVEDNILSVKCSDAVTVSFITDRRRNQQKTWDGETTMTEATFDMTKFLEDSVLTDTPAPYFRIAVKDKSGRIAYSRAYFLDEIIK